ncbi:Uncharacterized protein APZ42_016133 [Daphnia magna]|uniref:Uncharacterized protein n=1 Tax=Daphnia magna TaxID=35525 RepID=A0A0P4YAP8_9CRUS|nr:Uncharacterized protein APZ42_016133 [Daphnia magna]
MLIKWGLDLSVWQVLLPLLGVDSLQTLGCWPSLHFRVKMSGFHISFLFQVKFLICIEQ